MLGRDIEELISNYHDVFPGRVHPGAVTFLFSKIRGTSYGGGDSYVSGIDGLKFPVVCSSCVHTLVYLSIRLEAMLHSLAVSCSF